MTLEPAPSRHYVLPPTVLVVSILVSLALDPWFPVADLWGDAGREIGFAIIVAALGVNIHCAMQFRRRETTVMPFRESTSLITDGLYRFSRNPIYLSMVALLCGLAISLGSLSPWFVLPLFMWIITKLFIEKEEAMLSERFGEDYRKFCQRVRRWL